MISKAHPCTKQDDRRPLGHADRSMLSKCIVIVKSGREDAGLKRYGKALATIRDRRLYLESHANFDEFCRETFLFGRDRADQLINSIGVLSGVLEDFAEDGEELPTNCRHLEDSEGPLRPLGGVVRQDRTKVLRMASVAAKGKRVTARHVSEAVRQLKHEQSQYDEDDDEWLVERQNPYSLASRSLGRMIRTFRKISRDKSQGAYLENLDQKTKLIRELQQWLNSRQPQRICTKCKRKGCKHCRFTGFLITGDSK